MMASVSCGHNLVIMTNVKSGQARMPADGAPQWCKTRFSATGTGGKGRQKNGMIIAVIIADKNRIFTVYSYMRHL
ncbi:hypothetical protein UA45_15590 [Morganella morganii]|uniref:Uncharacterized protein n=1 Tax=Morganella morganii TaxID=582 RepID=A0A0D8L884_MORMO|nr:hypothetical protein UA45_15590 [Morganella morganii]